MNGSFLTLTDYSSNLEMPTANNNSQGVNDLSVEHCFFFHAVYTFLALPFVHKSEQKVDLYKL